jgi:hypothetical protein
VIEPPMPGQWSGVDEETRDLIRRELEHRRIGDTRPIMVGPVYPPALLTDGDPNPPTVVLQARKFTVLLAGIPGGFEWLVAVGPGDAFVAGYPR